MKKIFSTAAMAIMAMFSVVATASAATGNADEKEIAFLHCKQGTSYEVCMDNLSNAFGANNVKECVEDNRIKVLIVEGIKFNGFDFDEVRFAFDERKLVSVKLTKDFQGNGLKNAVAFRDKLVSYLSQKYTAQKKRVPNFQNIADFGLGYKEHKNSYDYPLFVFVTDYTRTTQTDGKAPVVTKGYDLELTYWSNDDEKLHAKYNTPDEF